MVNTPGDSLDDVQEAKPVSSPLHVAQDPSSIEAKDPIPTREEIMGMFALLAPPGFTVTNELSDADGIYLIEVTVQSGTPGEYSEYLYERKGERGMNDFTTSTSIAVAEYEGGEACGGRTLASLDRKTGKWVMGGGTL